MKRLIIISLFAILFIAFIINWNYSYWMGQEDMGVLLTDDKPTTLIPLEKGTFKRSKFALDYMNAPTDERNQRTLKTYYNNRAYWGAPPAVPHPVNNPQDIGGKSCLKCHENGGFVAKYNAYTPITPHPEMINCNQCHVAAKIQSSFKGTTFTKIRAPGIKTEAELLGLPPAIPHSLYMRNNCLSCHAGPGAPREIRVSHPERINCRQCHVLNEQFTAAIKPFGNDSDE